MGNDKNKRIDFVDLMKGVCIILTVMAHISGVFEKFDYHSMIASFRIPLYFFISGIFLKSYEGLFGSFIRKVNKLIIPFLFFYLNALLLRYIIWEIAPGVFQLPINWAEPLAVSHDHALIKFNPPIWFLLALFNCNILFYLVHSLHDRKSGLMLTLTLLIGIAGFYMGKHQIELPLYIDIAMTALSFYVAGFWVRRYNFSLFPHCFDKLTPLCILAALVVMYFTATSVGIRTNNYVDNIFQFWASAFASIFMIMLFCKKLKKLPVISYLGRYSVITLGIHAPLSHLEYSVVSRFIYNEWGQVIVLLLLTPAICIVVTPILLKLIPQAVAQKDFIRTRQSQQQESQLYLLSYLRQETISIFIFMITHYYIFLENVRLRSYHGVAPQETVIGNEFIINLRLKIDFGKATETDEVEDTASYADIHAVPKERMDIPSKLLEHVCEQTVKRFFRDSPKISEIEIKLSKRNPPTGAGIDSAGVEMHCTRD